MFLFVSLKYLVSANSIKVLKNVHLTKMLSLKYHFASVIVIFCRLNVFFLIADCRCDRRFSTGNCAEGTGICECKANFTGTNCDRCNSGFYDYPQCLPCECNFNGTQNALCNVGFGVCPCKPNFSGRKCDQCQENFYDFPNCTGIIIFWPTK